MAGLPIVGPAGQRWPTTRITFVCKMSERSVPNNVKGDFVSTTTKTVVPEELEEVSGEREVSDNPASDKQKKMDGTTKTPTKLVEQDTKKRWLVQVMKDE